MTLTILKSRTTPLLDLLELKTYLKIEHSEEDKQLTLLIEAATNWAEEYLDMTFLRQEFKLIWDAENDNQPLEHYVVHLPKPPILEVISIKNLIRSARVKRVYENLDNPTPYVMFNRDNPKVEIIYYAGFGDSKEEVPAAIRQGVLMAAGAMYEREDLTKHPLLEILKCYKVKKLK